MIALAVAGVVVLVLATMVGFAELRPHTSRHSLLSIAQSPPGPLPEACVSGRTCPHVLTAENSILKITSFAPGCHRTIVGTGFVYAPGQVLTNAHVVAGADRHRISVADRIGDTWAATLVGYDPGRDVAVLNVPDLPLGPIGLAAGSTIPASGMTAGFPKGGGFTAQGVDIEHPFVLAVGRDIYQKAIVKRVILNIRAAIKPGDAGSPLLDKNGQVVGLVFAADLLDPGAGYALPLYELAPLARKALGATTPVSAQGCSV